MDDDELYSRVRAGLADIIGFFGSASPGARVLNWPGVIASVVPSTPERSLFNSAQFASVAALTSEYAALEATFRAAAVRAFSVWVDPQDTAQAEWLHEHGHKLDGKPTAMAAELSACRLPELGSLSWSETREPAPIAEINEVAYGFGGRAWQAAFTQFEQPNVRGYVARVDGLTVASVITLDGPYGDCVIAGVATRPEFRGRGIASRLLAQALREAQARGAITTSLQSSTQGRSVYLRLGYRDLGAMELWERRF